MFEIATVKFLTVWWLLGILSGCNKQVVWLDLSAHPRQEHLVLEKPAEIKSMFALNDRSVATSAADVEYFRWNGSAVEIVNVSLNEQFANYRPIPLYLII